MMSSLPCPTAYLEGFFLDNPNDYTQFSTIEKQKSLGAAYAKGILEYLGIKWVNEGTSETPSTSATPTTNNKLFRVQVGAFSVKSNADNFQTELKKKGYDTMIVFIGGLYKIQVGAYSVRANADTMITKLKSDGYNGFIIGDTTI